MPPSETKVRNANPGAKTATLFDERGLYLNVSPLGTNLSQNFVN